MNGKFNAALVDRFGKAPLPSTPALLKGMTDTHENYGDAPQVKSNTPPPSRVVRQPALVRTDKGLSWTYRGARGAPIS